MKIEFDNIQDAQDFANALTSDFQEPYELHLDSVEYYEDEPCYILYIKKKKEIRQLIS